MGADQDELGEEEAVPKNTHGNERLAKLEEYDLFATILSR